MAVAIKDSEGGNPPTGRTSDGAPGHPLCAEWPKVKTHTASYAVSGNVLPINWEKVHPTSKGRPEGRRSG